jgi:hypothetical protein
MAARKREARALRLVVLGYLAGRSSLARLLALKSQDKYPPQ